MPVLDLGNPQRGGRTLGAVLGVLLIAILLSLTLPPPGRGAAPLGRAALTSEVVAGPAALPGWTTLGGSVNRSGATASIGPTVDDLRWERCLAGGAVRAGPLLTGSTVFAASEGGYLYALNRTDGGRVLWSRSIGPGPTTGDYAAPYLLLGTSDGRLSAVLGSNGSLAWSRALTAPVAQGIAVAGGIAYVATTSGQVEAFRVADGSPVWSVPAGAPVSGAVALEAGTVFLATTSGRVLALSGSNGSMVWQASVGATVASAPAVADGRVVVGDGSGNVTALRASDGTGLWRWDARSLLAADSLSSTPSIGEGRVAVATDLGEVVSLNATTGQPAWNRSYPNSGYPVRDGPVTTPGFVYAMAGATTLAAIELATGNASWSTSLDGGSASQSPLAVSGNEVVVGDDAGCVLDIGTQGGPTIWPVAGTVRDPSGAPLPDVQVVIGSRIVTTRADGAFEFALPNGTYTVYVFRTAYIEDVLSLNVSGAVRDLSVVLRPLATFELSGTVIDSRSGRGLGGANVRVEGEFGYVARTTTGPTGAFVLLAGNGSDELVVDGPGGYSGRVERIEVPGAAVAGVIVAVDPSGLSIPSADPHRLDLILPFGVLAAAALGLGIDALRSRRRAAGLPPALLSPFGRYVAMRALLIPGEVAAVLLLLYVFGTFLPAAAAGQNLCELSSAACRSCGWSDPGCVVAVFGNGFGTFLGRLATGDWGFASYGPLTEPASQFLQWWLPDSLELALVALALSVGIAYPVSILSSVRPESPLDVGSRLGSTLGLLVPSFLVLLAVYGVAYGPFSQALGDDPYGLVPSGLWLQSHGGSPPWIGIAGNTSPTGFPIVDSLWHRDWGFAALATAKTLLQAGVIALIYVAIYLRFLRGAVRRALAAPSVVAARARGLSEGTILWHHAGRRLLPTYLLVFGSTFPAYIGAQALVEALSNDAGLGTLLLSEILQTPGSGFGFRPGPGVNGNLYQVAIFLVVLLVLVLRLAADILARYLDPRMLEEGRR